MTSQTREVTIKDGKAAKSFVVHELDDWDMVAGHLASIIKSGSIVTLSGPLGAGKTTLVQYLAKTLGTPRRAISPTFALMRIYKLKGLQAPGSIRRLVHVDAYRIEDEKDLVVLDLDEELAEPGTVLLIEWPGNIKGWLADKKGLIEINIENK